MCKTYKIKVKYCLGKYRTFEFEKSVYHCPGCGSNKTYMQLDDPDFYLKEDHYCLSCNMVFNIPESYTANKDLELGILRELENISEE